MHCHNLDLDIELRQIKLHQFMQAHTVLKSIADEYVDKPVLVLGGKPGAVPAVAKEYAGFLYLTYDISDILTDMVLRMW